MRRITLPLYVGGFLGPFGGAMLAVLIPNVADGLDTSVALVAAAITAYMVPFAALQLFSGTLAERLGPRRIGRPTTALAGTLACAAGVFGLAFAPTAWSLGLVYLGVGCASAFVWAGLNTIAVESFPDNRAGAVSAYSAFKFAGVAIAPLMYVPLFHVDTRAPFLLAGALSAAVAVLLLPWFARYR